MPGKASGKLCKKLALIIKETIRRLDHWPRFFLVHSHISTPISAVKGDLVESNGA